MTEIASLPPVDVPEGYHNAMRMLLVSFMRQLNLVIPRDANLRKAYDDGTEDECLFVKRLALFLSTYLNSYLSLFDEVQSDGSRIHEEVIIEVLHYMVMVSTVDDEEIFKTCLEFWHKFCKELYSEPQYRETNTPFPPLNSGMGGSNGSPFRHHKQDQIPIVRPKPVVYEHILHRLRIVMIEAMAKPEEVIIVEDDNGEIIRELTKDTEVIAQYKTMRDAIVYLTHLNYEDSEQIMLKKLDRQLAGGEFSWNGLNTLCWAIGSISGAMGEPDEKRFLVSVIKDLLKLCEDQRGKDNKAVVASNIMYIVGQYPRFLRAHWKFLKTVVNKLFEFMHEHHPGVQDMACDTFLKIAQKCKRKFMIPQAEDPQPFILTLINDLKRHIADLQPHQIQSFYESVATMLSDSGPTIRLSREEVVLKLMELPNTSWRNIMTTGGKDRQFLLQLETVKEILKILKTNARVCASAGSIFVHQLTTVFMDILNVYRLYSEQIKDACVQQGAIATRLVLYKTMRVVKSEILELMTTFIEVSRDIQGGPQTCMQTFLPPLMNEVLKDYRDSPPAARDAKVLSLFSTAVIVLREHISLDIPTIMEAVFEPTLEMITSNM